MEIENVNRRQFVKSAVALGVAAAIPGAVATPRYPNLRGHAPGVTIEQDLAYSIAAASKSMRRLTFRAIAMRADILDCAAHRVMWGGV